MKKHKDILANALLLIFLILADQAAKYIIRSSGGFYICNPALAFGIRINSAVFYFLWILIVLFVSYSAANSKSKFLNPKQSQNPNILNSKRFWIFNFGNFNLFRIWDLGFGILLILSGALSNMIDRLKLGCVIDFMDLKFWPAFNLADVFITVGVIILVSQKLKRVTRNEKL